MLRLLLSHLQGYIYIYNVDLENRLYKTIKCLWLNFNKSKDLILTLHRTVLPK